MVAGLGVAALTGPGIGELIVGLDSGDDAAVVRIANGQAVIVTADFFTPVVDSAYDWHGPVRTRSLDTPRAQRSWPPSMGSWC